MASDRDDTTPTAQQTESTSLPVSADENGLTTATAGGQTPERRPYVEIRPTERTLSPRAVTQAMEQLHATLERATDTGLRNRLFGEASQPSVEWLLVADGRADTSIRYLVGATDPDLHDELQRICRTALPNAYEFQTVLWHPRDIGGLGTNTPVTEVYESTNNTDHPSADTQPLAGVEYRGHADRPTDWQTPLTPFADLNDDQSSRSNERTHRLPLTTLVETMRDADAPVVYQVCCRPYRDITPTPRSTNSRSKTGPRRSPGNSRRPSHPGPSRPTERTTRRPPTRNASSGWPSGIPIGRFR